MKWIRDIDGDLLNLSKLDYIYILYKGPDYPSPFHVFGSNSGNVYTINVFGSESEAQKFMARLQDTIEGS